MRQEQSTELQRYEKSRKSKDLLASVCPLRRRAEGTQLAGEARGREGAAAARQRELEGLEKGAGRKLLRLKAQRKRRVLQPPRRSRKKAWQQERLGKRKL